MSCKMLFCGLAALAVSACGTLEPRIHKEVVRFTCPKEDPPAFYELPARLQSVRPEEYRVERIEVEGLHGAFGERYAAYRRSRELCPKTED